MAYYMATICIDRGPHNDQNGSQIVVHWDDNDPNRFITAPITVNHPVTSETELRSLLESAGYSIVSHDSDNIGRGFAIVKRSAPGRPFYHPVKREWVAALWDDDKREIRAKYPDAKIPCVP